MILRPSERILRQQIYGALALGVLLAGLLVVIEDGFSWTVRAAFGAGAAGLAIAVQAWWFRRSRNWRGVLTPDGLLLRGTDGRRRAINWADVQRAQHATGLLGMRWRLELLDTTVVLRDIGIAPDRWAVLWRGIIAGVGGKRPVRVDTISNLLFDPE